MIVGIARTNAAAFTTGAGLVFVPGNTYKLVLNNAIISGHFSRDKYMYGVM